MFLAEISNSDLWTILLVLAIIALILYLFRRF